MDFPIRNHRRSCIHQAHEARLRLEDGLSFALLSARDSQPGTPLPDGFPYATELARVGYVCREDLDGRPLNTNEAAGLQAELQTIAGLGTQAAKAVLSALGYTT